jgi:tetratricopeptide (TPR) repeat protein
VVPEFTVIVRHPANQPALFARKHFTNGEFTLDGLTRDNYQLQIASPLFVSTRVNIDFTADSRPTNYCIVILHTFRNESQVAPNSTHSVSVKMLQQKVPRPAVEAYERAAELHRNGKLEEALIEYGKALRAYPQYIAALTDLGSIFILYNRPESALLFLRRAQDIDDRDPVINLNIASALTQQNDYGSALKLLKKVLHEDPRMGLAHFYIGKVYYIQKKFDAAEEAARQAVEKDPTLIDAWLLLADASLELRKYTDAREALMHIREIIHNRTVVDLIDEQLSMLGG